jgi:hypothetical protein
MEIGIFLAVVVGLLVLCVAIWRLFSLQSMLTLFGIIASMVFGGFMERQWHFVSSLLAFLGIA